MLCICSFKWHTAHTSCPKQILTIPLTQAAILASHAHAMEVEGAGKAGDEEMKELQQDPEHQVCVFLVTSACVHCLLVLRLADHVAHTYSFLSSFAQAKKQRGLLS